MNARSKLAKPAGEAGSEGEAEAPSAPDHRALSEFFSSLAHDLRSPIGVVSSALSELRSDFAEGLTDEHRLLVNMADRGVRRLTRLAEAVSFLSTLESGSFELKNVASVNLVELVREAIAAASAIEPRREVEILSDLPEAPCPLKVDSERLSRAVSEIVINAVRHARRKARVRLEVKPGEARIMIEDDGQGVAPEWQGHIFRRFSPRPSRSGLGLGLPIAHAVVVAHRGQLLLEASTLAPGRPGTTGACFVISLPLPSEGSV